MQNVVDIVFVVLCLTLSQCSARDVPEDAYSDNILLCGEETLSITDVVDDDYGRVLGVKVSNLEWRYNAGDSMPITVSIRNYGSRFSESDSRRVRHGAQLYPFITVWVREDVNEHARKERVRLPIENRFHVRMKESFECEIDISKVKMLSKPGTYFISVGHRNCATTDIGDWMGILRSREQMVWIEH